MALIEFSYRSDVLRRTTVCRLLLPQPAAPTPGMRYPVLWLLHGAGDDETAWLRRSNIERYARQYGLVVVMPQARLSSYTDMAHGDKVFTHIADELPVVLGRCFPLSSKRRDTFIAGLSMGSGGALKISLARPQRFAAVGCLSAGLNTVENRAVTGNAAFAPVLRAAYEGRDIRNTEEDTVSAARRIVADGLPAPRIYHACGSSDFMLEDAHRMHSFFSSFAENPFDYTYEEDPGAHEWDFWDAHIQRFLTFTGLEEKHGFR